MADAVKNRVEELTKGLMPRDQAIQKFKMFDGCKEVPLGNSRVKLTNVSGVDNEVILESNKSEFILNDDAFAKLCRIIGIPETYVDKTPKELFFPHIQHWLGDAGGKEVKALEKGTNAKGQHKVVGFLKQDACYYPVTNILKQVDKISTDYLIESPDTVNWRTATFGIVFPKHEFMIKDKNPEKGDFLYGGIKIRASMFGEFPMKMSAFLMTLVCLNGMISANEVYSFNRKRMAGGEDEFVADGMKQGLSVLQAEVDRVAALKKFPLDNAHIVPYIESAFNDMGINQASRLAVSDSIIEKNPKTLYDLMQAITWSVRHLKNRDEAYGVQQLGGFIATHASKCPSCHRPN